MAPCSPRRRPPASPAAVESSATHRSAGSRRTVACFVDGSTMMQNMPESDNTGLHQCTIRAAKSGVSSACRVIDVLDVAVPEKITETSELNSRLAHVHGAAAFLLDAVAAGPTPTIQTTYAIAHLVHGLLSRFDATDAGTARRTGLPSDHAQGGAAVHPASVHWSHSAEPRGAQLLTIGSAAMYVYHQSCCRRCRPTAAPPPRRGCRTTPMMVGAASAGTPTRRWRVGGRAAPPPAGHAVGFGGGERLSMQPWVHASGRGGNPPALHPPNLQATAVCAPLRRRLLRRAYRAAARHRGRDLRQRHTTSPARRWPPIVQHFVEAAGWRQLRRPRAFCALTMPLLARCAAAAAGSPRRRGGDHSDSRSARRVGLSPGPRRRCSRRRHRVLRRDGDAAGAHRRVLRRPRLRRGARAQMLR